MKPKISLLIADDHAIVRQGLSSIFRFQPDFSVVAEAEDGEEAVSKTSSLHPDVVIMDLLMPQMDGAEATARIKRANPDTHVIILTSYGDSPDLVAALENGASGALTKTAPKEELFACIRDVVSGMTVISTEIQQSLLEDTGLQTLTSRQLEILHSLSRGLTNKEIAKQFGLTTAGVKSHLISIFRKLEVSNRSEAVAIALRKHLLKI